MSKSVKRVRAALEAAGIEIEIVEMPDSTRTAEEAAIACKAEVGQIVKSLIFEGQDSGRLQLLLVSGDHQVDMELANRPSARGWCEQMSNVFARKQALPLEACRPLVIYRRCRPLWMSTC